MRHNVWLVSLGLAFAFGAAGATPPSSLDFGVSATVDVDRDGRAHVVEMEKVTKLSDVPSLVPVAELIAHRLRDRIESWQFVPATQDGAAMPSRTHLGVSMNAIDDGHGGMTVRIVSASTGGSVKERDMRAIVAALQKSPQEAFLVVDMHYASDGHVLDVVITEARSFSAGNFTGRVNREFQKGIALAFKRWTFDPELVNGRPIEGHGTMPMRFCLSSACANAEGEQDSSPNAAQFAGTNSAVKLRSAVAGTAL